jgi:hypothetical protein
LPSWEHLPGCAHHLRGKLPEGKACSPSL